MLKIVEVCLLLLFIIGVVSMLASVLVEIVKELFSLKEWFNETSINENLIVNSGSKSARENKEDIVKTIKEDHTLKKSTQISDSMLEMHIDGVSMSEASVRSRHEPSLLAKQKVVAFREFQKKEFKFLASLGLGIAGLLIAIALHIDVFQITHWAWDHDSERAEIVERIKENYAEYEIDSNASFITWLNLTQKFESTLVEFEMPMGWQNEDKIREKIKSNLRANAHALVSEFIEWEGKLFYSTLYPNGLPSDYTAFTEYFQKYTNLLSTHNVEVSKEGSELMTLLQTKLRESAQTVIELYTIDTTFEALHQRFETLKLSNAEWTLQTYKQLVQLSSKHLPHAALEHKVADLANKAEVISQGTDPLHEQVDAIVDQLVLNKETEQRINTYYGTKWSLWLSVLLIGLAATRGTFWFELMVKVIRKK
ncbi:MAG: hypothetical protein KDC12_11295 [Flavobacteriales bacterium]|nr:hypothetical protein [Flavobacteriales bacterium]